MYADNTLCEKYIVCFSKTELSLVVRMIEDHTNQVTVWNNGDKEDIYIIQLQHVEVSLIIPGGDEMQHSHWW